MALAGCGSTGSDGARNPAIALLSFGQDDAGEIHVLTSALPGPTGRKGKAYRLVAARQAWRQAAIDER
jgi:hypothetical protein